jgi:primosomal protein N''
MSLISAEGKEVDSIFDELNSTLEAMERTIASVEKFEAEILSNQDLFDTDDLQKVRGTLDIRRQEHRMMVTEFDNLRELYRKTVHELELKVNRRQKLLEKLDHTDGAVSAEPLLLEYFGKKQALFTSGIAEAKKRLCNKIKDKLTQKA